MAQSDGRKTCYKGEKAYIAIDSEALHETGEIKIVGAPIEVDEIVKSVPRQGFEITYLTYLVDLFDKLGGKKYRVFKYIIMHKSNDDNSLIITTKELAKVTNTSIQTVQSTINLLRNAGLIQKKVGSIMLNPKVAHRGTNQKEKYLLQRFEAFDQADSTEK